MDVFGSGSARTAFTLMVLASAAMWPAAADAYTPEQQQACSGDAMRLCGAEIPDVDRITACMIRNKAQLSPPCRAQFRDDPDPPAADPAAPVDIRPSTAVSGKARKTKKPAKATAD